MSHKILWFQHLHKCAGSSVIEGARTNGLKFYPWHANGNPKDESGKELELWNYTSAELAAFLDHVRNLSVSFIATEWGGPCFRTLHEQADVRVVTVIRNPLARMRSNYYYDISAGFSQASCIEDYVGSAGNWTQHNYYTRIFSRHTGDSEVTDEDFEKARDAMALIDDVFLQNSDLDSNVTNRLGWKNDLTRRNKTPKGVNVRMLAWSLRNGNWRGVWRSLTASRKISEKFKEDFKERNRYDLRLYEIARKVAVTKTSVD